MFSMQKSMIQYQAQWGNNKYVELHNGLELRALQRLSHTTEGHHFDGLILINPILAAFTAKPAELNPTKPMEF